MNAAAAQQPGYTTVVTANQMLAPITFSSRDNGGPIRSVTVGNQTSSTTVSVYLSGSSKGQLLYSVLPGNYATIPIMASSAITLGFAFAIGGLFDGTVFVHTDPEPLAASGFTQSQANIVGLTPVVAYLSSQANGGGTAGFVPPLFQSNGNADSPYNKMVSGSVLVPVASGATIGQAQFPLSGEAVFQNYAKGFANVNYGLTSTQPPGWTRNVIWAQCEGGSSSANIPIVNSFAILIAPFFGGTSTGTGFYYVDFFLIGY